MSDRAASRTSGLSDQDLMRRVQADDTLAFEELYDRYCARAFSLARVICDAPRSPRTRFRTGSSAPGVIARGMTRDEAARRHGYWH